MVQSVEIATGADDLAMVEYAEAAVAVAADHPGLSPTKLAQKLRCQRGDLGHRLEQRLVLSPDLTDESAATAELLTLRLQCELLDQDLCRRVECLTEIRNALRDLRGLSPRKMIDTAPVVLSREFGFGRTLISAVRGSQWLPQHLHIEGGGGDLQSRLLREFIARSHIQLADAPFEAELIRKRCGALVPCPREDKRTFKEFVEVFGCRGYIAAPITVQDRAIGMLHADSPEPDGRMTMGHLDRLEAFAECLAVAFESAVLEEKAAQQRLVTDNLCANVDELLCRMARPALWSSPGATPGQRHDAYDRSDQPAVPALTIREREIMSHVATGATNSEIARYLVISEGTVKSHLKHIAKKLNTSSRAAAVAVYAGIVG